MELRVFYRRQAPVSPTSSPIPEYWASCVTSMPIRYFFYKVRMEKKLKKKTQSIKHTAHLEHMARTSFICHPKKNPGKSSSFTDSVIKANIVTLQCCHQFISRVSNMGAREGGLRQCEQDDKVRQLLGEQPNMFGSLQMFDQLIVPLKTHSQ